MLTSSGAQSSPLRRLLVTLGVLAVFRLGCFIPLPGVDVVSFLQGGMAGSSLSRISIFAVGLNPVLLVLACCEAIKLALPPLLRWEQADEANRQRLTRILRCIALVFAGIQAWQVALAMERVTALVPEPGSLFRLGIVATIVGATILLLWLADLVTRYGLVSGFWLLWLAPHLADLPGRLAIVAELQRIGELTPGRLGAGALWVVGATLLILLIAKARFEPSAVRRGLPHDFVDSLARSPAAFDVGPLFAAAIVSGMAMTLLLRIGALSSGPLVAQLTDPVGLSLLVLGFYLLRAQTDLVLARQDGGQADRGAAMRQALMTAAVLIVIDVSGALLSPWLPAVTVLVVGVLVAARCIEVLAGRT